MDPAPRLRHATTSRAPPLGPCPSKEGKRLPAPASKKTQFVPLGDDANEGAREPQWGTNGDRISIGAEH